MLLAVMLQADMTGSLKSVVGKQAKIGSISLTVPLGVGTMFWGDSYVDSLFGPIVPREDLQAVTELALESKVRRPCFRIWRGIAIC